MSSSSIIFASPTSSKRHPYVPSNVLYSNPPLPPSLPPLQVSLYNPLLVLLALFCFPISKITEKEQASLIAHMGGIIGDWLSSSSSSSSSLPTSPSLASSSSSSSSLPSWGSILQTTVAVDAFLVLAGSVLTAYVGIGGLINRWGGREGGREGGRTTILLPFRED